MLSQQCVRRMRGEEIHSVILDETNKDKKRKAFREWLFREKKYDCNSWQ